MTCYIIRKDDLYTCLEDKNPRAKEILNMDNRTSEYFAAIKKALDEANEAWSTREAKKHF
ncbi:MAG: hypothetical protein WCR70_10380 [Sphaerochaetaceae bacterium]